jgi:hypothetical protein
MFGDEEDKVIGTKNPRINRPHSYVSYAVLD